MLAPGLSGAAAALAFKRALCSPRPSEQAARLGLAVMRGDPRENGGRIRLGEDRRAVHALAAGLCGRDRRLTTVRIASSSICPRYSCAQLVVSAP